MKWALIGFVLACGALNAGLHDQRIQEIQLEITDLEKQKQVLQREASASYRQEMHHEMQGQKEFIEYEWHDYGESLQKAEAAEQYAHSKEGEIRKIDQKLIQLNKEKNSLLQQEKSAN